MSPRGGRRPVLHNVFAIEDDQLALPDLVALDTSFVVEALLTTQPLHGAAGAETMVTTDTGFALMPASLLSVYTDQNRVASCRKKRPRG